MTRMQERMGQPVGEARHETEEAANLRPMTSHHTLEEPATGSRQVSSAPSGEHLEHRQPAREGFVEDRQSTAGGGSDNSPALVREILNGSPEARSSGSWSEATLTTTSRILPPSGSPRDGHQAGRSNESSSMPASPRVSVESDEVLLSSAGQLLGPSPQGSAVDSPQRTDVDMRRQVQDLVSDVGNWQQREEVAAQLPTAASNMKRHVRAADSVGRSVGSPRSFQSLARSIAKRDIGFLLGKISKGEHSRNAVHPEPRPNDRGSSVTFEVGSDTQPSLLSLPLSVVEEGPTGSALAWADGTAKGSKKQQQVAFDATVHRLCAGTSRVVFKESNHVREYTPEHDKPTLSAGEAERGTAQHFTQSCLRLHFPPSLNTFPSLS